MLPPPNPTLNLHLLPPHHTPPPQAGDLFAQLASQRAEVRRSALELAGANEAMRDARDEALFFRGQYKLKEAERAEAAAALGEAQALNSVIQEQVGRCGSLVWLFD
mgnify:CR=1 FL=1